MNTFFTLRRPLVFSTRMGNGGGTSGAEGTGGELSFLDGAAIASRIGEAGNDDGFNKGFLQ
jgi:hypothetical protein